MAPALLIFDPLVYAVLIFTRNAFMTSASSDASQATKSQPPRLSLMFASQFDGG
ncbi:hypothetical protein [uncultured Methylovirgula sp.]|uniref:hypothetical protein n=1 Tax=uncultured Methylovirgula sp. TaxID=1285960 RepID=UPI00260B751D|nr:hypothetical protein [uncultured Methylovirgula sp.]